jgi:hypothetical protein
MDRFMKQHQKQILKENFTDLDQCVCVLGKTGIGKTYAVNKALGGHYIEIKPDILKCKQTTIDFLERVQYIDTPILLDEFETVQDLIGIREIRKPPTRGKFVIISQIPIENKFDFKIKTYDFPVPTAEELKKMFPAASDNLISKSKGDIRFVKRGIEFSSDDPDEFLSSDEFILKLVSKSQSDNPVQYVGVPIQEPGHVVSILQENYVDAHGINYAQVGEYMSVADLCETKVYEGEWQYLNYFNFFGCILPSVEIGHRLDPQKIRPGSTWTKYQNMCMRKKRLSQITDRTGRSIHFDTIMLLRKYAEHEQVDKLQEYGVESKDIDVMNHLSPFGKLQPKLIRNLKKQLTPP